jgi:hypothetical protein
MPTGPASKFNLQSRLALSSAQRRGDAQCRKRPSPRSRARLHACPISNPIKPEKRPFEFLRADYWRDVRSTAESVLDDIREERMNGNLWDRLNEAIDGHQRVICTGLAMETLLLSNNDDAGAEELGAEQIVSDETISWSKLAFFAFYADVYEHLNTLTCGGWGRCENAEDLRTELGDVDPE